MNNLVSYGIQDEQSDLRVHVSVSNQMAYLFPTKNALAVAKTLPGEFVRIAKTGKEITAIGYIVPLNRIPGMMAVRIPDDIFHEARFSETDNTSEKGRKAEFVVREMIRDGLIVPVTAESVKDLRSQISGSDIVISVEKVRLQVKCDWRAGQTGNVFLQTHERNPYQLH